MDKDLKPAKEPKKAGSKKTSQAPWIPAGCLLLLAGLFVFTPLGKPLRDWWMHQQDERLYGEACGAWDAGNVELAKGDCEKILAHEPAFSGALVILGKYWAEKADPPDWEKAADYESRALAAKPDFPTQLAYGGSLWKLKKYEDSEKVFRDCMAQEPQNSQVYEQLGWVLVCEEQYGEAVQVFAQGLKLDPENKRMKGWRREALRRLSSEG